MATLLQRKQRNAMRRIASQIPRSKLRGNGYMKTKTGGWLRRAEKLPAVPAGMSTAETVVKAAAAIIVPDVGSQRKAFRTLMPSLYVLRNKGCSWSHLAQLINGCGFNLAPASVRSYYANELVALGK